VNPKSRFHDSTIQRFNDLTNHQFGLFRADFFDVLDHIAHTLKLFGFFVRDFVPEFLLEGHDQLDRVQGIGAQIFDKLGIGSHLIGADVVTNGAALLADRGRNLSELCPTSTAHLDHDVTEPGVQRREHRDAARDEVVAASQRLLDGGQVPRVPHTTHVCERYGQRSRRLASRTSSSLSRCWLTPAGRYRGGRAD